MPLLLIPNSNLLLLQDSFKEIIITFVLQLSSLHFFSFSFSCYPSCNITKTLYCYYCVLGSLRQPAATLSGERPAAISLVFFLISKLYCKGICLRSRCKGKEFYVVFFTFGPFRVIKTKKREIVVC